MFAIKKLGEDIWRIVFLVIVVLLILFIGYSFDDGLQKTEDFAGKAFEFFAKHEKKENQQQKQIESFESFCKESDTVTTANTGFNPFARGNIEYSEKNSLDSSSAINNVITKTDHCKNKLKLIEYSCDNYKQKGQELFSIVDCEFGCDEQFGKCKN